MIQKKWLPLPSDADGGSNAARMSRGILFASVIFLSFLPLIIFKGLANPFVFGRSLALRLLAAVCIAPLFFLWKRRPETRPRNSALLWSVGALLLFAILNAFHGVDTLRSFAGDLERADGIFTLLAFGVFFLVLQTLLRSGTRWKTLWDVQVAVGMLVCLLAIARLFAIQTLRVGGGESQLIGTLGNPAFFGEYIFVLLLCAGMRISTSEGKRRWLHGIAASIFLTAAIWSQVRGVFLAVVVSAVLLCVIFRKELRELWNTRTFHGRALLFVPALLIFSVLNVAVHAGSFSRLRALLHPFRESTIQQRFLLWHGMGEAFLDRPWLGWGEENQIAAFYRHVPPRLWFYTGEVFDRAHNAVFDLLVAGGLVGVVCAGYVVLAGWRTTKNACTSVVAAERQAMWVGLCILIGYAVSLLLFFHTQAASWVLVLFAAFLADRGGNKEQVGFGIPGWKTQILGIGCALLFFWTSTFQPGAAAIASARAMRLFSTDRNQALSAAEQSYTFHSVVSREFAKHFAGRLVAEGSIGITDVSSWTQSAAFAQHALIEEANRHPWDPSPLLVLAGLEDIWSGIEPVAGISGLAHLERGVARHTESTDGRLRLALLLTKAWQGRVAIQELQAAIETTPENPYWFRTLGLVHGLLGQRSAAEAVFQKTNEVTARFFPPQRVQTQRELEELRNRIRGVPLMHHVPLM